MGKEVGGVFSMGNTCTSMEESSQYMAKSIQYCEVISLQLININGNFFFFSEKCNNQFTQASASSFSTSLCMYLLFFFFET